MLDDRLPTADLHPFPNGDPPVWASGWGHDRFGPFVEIEIGGVSQRLRWIPPGAFLMGSPDGSESGAMLQASGPKETQQQATRGLFRRLFGTRREKTAQRPAAAPTSGEPSRFDAEGPQHFVRLEEGFWLFSTPVTQGLYQAVTGENPSEFKTPDRPVEQVSWDEAQAFIAALNDGAPGLDLRLPSEAEWEYACRAGTVEATYAGPMEILGANNAPVLDAIAWYGGNSGVGYELEDGFDSSGWVEKQYAFAKAGTRPVGLKKPNAWGLYDMLGNVFEWCADPWHDSYDGAPDDGSAREDAAANAALRVLRGGSWRVHARNVRAAFRLRYEPHSRYHFLGFRCARGRSEPGQDGKGAAAAWRARSRAPQPARPAAEARRYGDEPQTPLDWAQHVARDEFGLYAEIAVDAARQRLRWIKPGNFLMGSPESERGRFDHEGPQHSVQIVDGFWLFDTPVTQALFELVMGENPSRYVGAERPVEQVSFWDVETFSKRLNDRVRGLNLVLPSEAQWEYACRSGSATSYYFGEEVGRLGDYCWFADNSGGKTQPVARKLPNDWGLYDMHGNVWEWCSDHWHTSYNSAPVDGSPWISADKGTGAHRSLRGGAWLGLARDVRVASRDGCVPQDWLGHLGFRCANISA